MERFEEVDDQYDPHAVEDRVFEYWETVDAYERTVEHRADGEDYYFLDGPPYTSGAAHMGTTWNKVLKDAYIRFLRMRGYDVYDRPGYDMHGLPIETRVEENLGFENKKDIEAFGVEPFIEECKSFAEEQLDGLQADFRSFGVWMNWTDPYKTVTPEYMEAAWWAFAQAHERGLVTQGKRSITQCPRCETAIAKNEVEYHSVESPSIYVRFPLVDREGSLVIWTTTPWTVPANTFVAVDEEMAYRAVRARPGGQARRGGRERPERGGSEGNEGDGTGDAAETDRTGDTPEGDLLYVEASCVEETMAKAGYDSWTVEEELSGGELIGWAYEHPLAEEVPDHPDGPGAFEVYHADYVEADRTGLVHSAPGHGQEDFERGQELDLAVFCPVGGDGVYLEAAGTYAGTFVRNANDDIIADLDEKGLLLHAGTHTHDYGQCWRCDTDIVFLATDQWFITVTDIKDDLLDNIADSEWHPAEARDERFYNFVEESPDWNVSRQRYWGIPIPIWTPAAGGEGTTETDADGADGTDADGADGTDAGGTGWSGDMDDAIVVGTREELADRVDQSIDPDAVDLHKPTVDDLTITADGTTYTRVPDVFDVWLDSSVASWGTLGYPGSDEAFERLWPADLIIEAHDQTRGWFWSQLGMGTAALGETPYDRVVMHGHALMPDGRAMSKSKDITVDPGEVIESHGTDPMRAFLLSVAPQGDDMRFSWEETETMQRNLNILWNVFRFPLPYMRLDGFDPGDRLEVGGFAADLETVDRWVLSRLQSVEAEMLTAWEEFRQDRALDALLGFVVEDVSRFYIQVVRERMWEEEDSSSKRAAYATIFHVLGEVAALLAPYAPFLADDIYGNLTGDGGHPTVHMCDWPEPAETWRDERLESDVEYLRAVEEAGSNARQQAERKLRWPVRRVVVAADDEEATAAVDRQRDLLRERLNAREIELVEPGERWGELTYSAEADMAVLGPDLGEDAARVMEALNDASVDDPTLDALEAAVAAETGMDVELTEETVDIVTNTPEGVTGAVFAIEGDDLGVVYVDTTLTEDIESEGYAREIVRRVQEMRKDLELDIDEEIRLDLDIEDDRVAELVRDHEEFIAREVRAAEFESVEDGHRREWTVEGVPVDIAIEPQATAPA